MGDEARRSQLGNNNAYCQDNEESWFDWRLLDKHQGLYRFVSLLNARRVWRNDELERKRVSLNQLLRSANLSWHGVKLNDPDWRSGSHSIALTTELRQDKLLLHWILNAYWEPLDFELPSIQGSGANPWRRWIDTALPSPQDISDWQTAAPFQGSSYRAEARSVVALFVRLNSGGM